MGVRGGERERVCELEREIGKARGREVKRKRKRGRKRKKI